MTRALPPSASPPLSNSAELAVKVTGLRKVFGDRTAVDGVSLAVPRGSFFGMVGPNGAGKTTSIRMMTGLLKPDAGTVVVDGVDVWEDPVSAKARFGVLPDDLRLFERLTGRELLTYVALLRRIPPAVTKERTEQVLDVLGLGRSADELVADYSQGMRKKIGLGAAILHVPAVLFLDEPFESVDPVSARALQEVLGQFRASGGTIIFSSHVMATVERLCDRVAIVHQGAVVRTGETATVCGSQSLEETFIDAVGAMEVRPDQLAWLRAGLAAAS